MDLIYTSLFLASICLLLLAVKFINSIQRQKEGGRVAPPPGPWNLPFIGSLYCMLGSKVPHRTFRDLSAVYGPIMQLKLGQINTVVVSSPEAAREVMKTHDIAFATRPINATIAQLSYGGSGIIFGPNGDFWRQMRRMCNFELLSAKRVRSFRAVREEEVSCLIRALADSSGTVINFSSATAEVSNNIMARAVIGGRCSDQKLFFATLNEVVGFISGLNAVDLFPSFPFIRRWTGYDKKVEQCKMRLDQMAERILNEHVDKMATRYIKEEDELLMEEDLIDVLLRIQREGSLPLPLTNERIKAVVNDILFAGSETTGTTMEWIMSELIQNPNIMEKAQREVRDALGCINMLGKLVEEEILYGKLPYLQMVIKEALRLHPPGPLLLPRENQESYKVMGYEIPAKTTVLVNVWAIGRDKRYWSKPNMFWPERFEESSLDFKGFHFEFIPFGAGRRICPGIQFGLATLEIVLAFLLYYFDWEFLGKKLDMTESFGVTVRRESPLYVAPTLRIPLPSQLT